MDEKGDDAGEGCEAHGEAEEAAIQQADREIKAQMLVEIGLDGGEHALHSTT